MSNPKQLFSYGKTTSRAWWWPQKLSQKSISSQSYNRSKYRHKRGLQSHFLQNGVIILVFTDFASTVRILAIFFWTPPRFALRPSKNEILVSAQGPLGIWIWGLGVWGLGLTKESTTAVAVSTSTVFLCYVSLKSYFVGLKPIKWDWIDKTDYSL